jgi:hypothetical protein
LNDETQQEFAVVAEQLAHRALVWLPVGVILREAVPAIVDGVKTEN